MERRTVRQINGKTDSQTNKWKDGQTDKQMERRTDRQTNGKTDSQTNKWKDGQSDK